MGGHHLGILVKGSEVQEPLRSLASSLGRCLLVVRRAEGVTWAWLGGRIPFEMDELLRALRAEELPADALALGEPGEDLAGWRFSHRQAKAALPVALCGSEPVVRYADVALIAALLQDELLATSLCRLYLAPLLEERDGGASLRGALRAYFSADRNVSSAAAKLGVSRQTIATRLRAVEERLGRSLKTCAADCEAALRFWDLQQTPRRALD